MPLERAHSIFVLMPEIAVVFQPEAYTLLAALKAFFTGTGLDAFVVGGFPRDLVLNRQAMDIDVALDADIDAIGQRLAEKLDARPVLLDEVNRIIRLVLRQPGLQGWHVDLSLLYHSLDEDLERRDFTLDAMSIALNELDLSSRQANLRIYDPLGGLNDIGAGLIRATGKEVFKNDSIRLLRAVRLAAELRFLIESGTESLIRRDSNLICTSAGERVREELLRLLSLTGTAQSLLYMERLGLLTSLIPEIIPSVGLEQHDEHQWNVFEHSARSAAAFDFLLKRDAWPYAGESVLDDVPWNTRLKMHFEKHLSPVSTHRELGKLAALLHDVAKPQTRTISNSGRLRFYGHPQQGAAVAESIMERLRFSSRENKLVSTVIRYHLRPVQMSHGDEMPSRRAVYRFVRDLGTAAEDTLFFSLADHLATRGENLDLTNWRHHANIVAYVLAEASRTEMASPRKLLDGYDLQRQFGLHPGPALGEILDELREAQATGEIASRDEAIAYTKELIVKQDPK